MSMEFNLDGITPQDFAPNSQATTELIETLINSDRTNIQMFGVLMSIKIFGRQSRDRTELQEALDAIRELTWKETLDMVEAIKFIYILIGRCLDEVG